MFCSVDSAALTSPYRVDFPMQPAGLDRRLDEMPPWCAKNLEPAVWDWNCPRWTDRSTFR
jgi:hypothetical protein